MPMLSNVAETKEKISLTSPLDFEGLCDFAKRISEIIIRETHTASDLALENTQVYHSGFELSCHAFIKRSTGCVLNFASRFEELP